MEGQTNTLILNNLGIRHTGKTLVGNESIRGVSGEERERVSLAKMMAGQSSIQCWDKATRGLDASTAIDFGKVLSADANTKKSNCDYLISRPQWDLCSFR